MLIIEVNQTQLLIIASLFVVILLSLMIARHFEKKQDKDMVDKVYEDIEIE